MAQVLTPVVPQGRGGAGGRSGNKGPAKGSLVAVAPKGSAGPKAARPGNPVAAWDQRSDAAAWAVQPEEAGARSLRSRRAIEGLLIALAVADNILCYVTFFTVNAFHGRLYNIVDLHHALLPGIGIALVVFTAAGTASFAALFVLVECCHQSLFHELMNFFLYCSALPSGVICCILVYHSEETQWAPFTTLLAILCLIIAWCVHMRVLYSHELNVISKVALDVSWFLAVIAGVVLAIFFSASAMEVITKSDDLGCAYAANQRMPVHALTLDRWYCSPWSDSEAQEISREPVTGGTALQLSCSDSFVGLFGVSIEPHEVKCPAGCLKAYQGSSIVGCGIYSTDSPLCLAAIHAGVLDDRGGETVVYGRVGVPRFERCNRNSVTSLERVVEQVGATVGIARPATGGSSTFVLPTGTGTGRRLSVPAPLVLRSDGTPLTQAFHFNNLPETREFLWLQRWETISAKAAGVVGGKPWTQIEATVSARLAGIEIEDEKIRLGQPAHQQLFVAPLPGQVFDEQPVTCRVNAQGVLCQGLGAAMLQLDFCQPDVKTCLDG